MILSTGRRSRIDMGELARCRVIKMSRPRSKRRSWTLDECFHRMRIVNRHGSMLPSHSRRVSIPTRKMLKRGLVDQEVAEEARHRLKSQPDFADPSRSGGPARLDASYEAGGDVFENTKPSGFREKRAVRFTPLTGFTPRGGASRMAWRNRLSVSS
ncbi:MAG: hypothetical protein HW389_978 [Bacteroidetes bacterium]|nr:hypothetical protein [Bacteroidota bacterium]